MSYDVQNSGTKAVQHRSVGRECGQCGTRFFGIVVDCRGIGRTDVCGCEVEIVDPDQELDDEIDRGDGPIPDGGRDRWEYGHAAARRADQSDRELRADGGRDPVNNPEDRRRRYVPTPESRAELRDHVADVCLDALDAGVPEYAIEKELKEVIYEIEEAEL